MEEDRAILVGEVNGLDCGLEHRGEVSLSATADGQRSTATAGVGTAWTFEISHAVRFLLLKLSGDCAAGDPEGEVESITISDERTNESATITVLGSKANSVQTFSCEGRKRGSNGSWSLHDNEAKIAGKSGKLNACVEGEY